MSRRIEIELTSVKDDETWTWRAAGAREPKGVIAASLLPDGAAVGQELRVEAEFFVDGIEITSVLPAKGERKEPERLELLGSGGDQAGVTTQLVPKRGRGRGDRDGGRGGGRGGDRDGRGRGRRDGRDGGGRDGRDGRDGGGRRGGDNRGRGEGRTERPRKPALPPKPKPKRLRPRREHRDAALAALPEAQRAIAEQVLRGGIPGVRKAVEEQNSRNKAEGRPSIDAAPLVQLAEELLPPLKEAEWHDRADAAMAGMAELDLRDLRSVVVAADSATRSDETRSLADQLRDAVAARVDQDQAAWLADITSALEDERTVRALRMSSRPPKAGAPLPPDVGNRLAEAAGAALSADTGPQRWGTVLDAVAYSPIRQSVTPQGIPSRPNDELLETVKRLSSRVPEIAALFGIEAQETPARRRGRGGRSGSGGGRKAPPAPPKRPAAAPAAEGAAATAEAPAAQAPTVPPEAEPTATGPEPAVEVAAGVAEPAAEVAAGVAEPAVEVAAGVAERRWLLVWLSPQRRCRHRRPSSATTTQPRTWSTLPPDPTTRSETVQASMTP